MRAQCGITCCGEAGTLEDARVALHKVAPDILLLDLGFKVGDGLEFIREALALQPALRIIVISQRDESVFAERTLKAGASGYLMKSEAVECLLEAIETVMAGEVHLSRTAAAHVAAMAITPGLRKSRDVAGLSDRELQVFALIGAGLGPKEIATLAMQAASRAEATRGRAFFMVGTVLSHTQSGAGPRKLISRGYPGHQ